MMRYIVRGILCVRRLADKDWELWFGAHRGESHATDVVQETIGDPGWLQYSCSWSSQLGVARKMLVGQTVHIACQLAVSYSSHYDHYSGATEFDAEVEVLRCRTLSKTTMTKRRMKREWRD